MKRDSQENLSHKESAKLFELPSIKPGQEIDFSKKKIL